MSSKSKWLPTRLVDVGFEGDRQWRLIETAKEKTDATQPYMTLSYRWGPHPTLLLKSSNFHLFQSGNPIEQLPLTFRDAVVVTRHFGVRYLWIDCLCIVQDSDPDWEAEAPMMRHVFANSMCNIAASASEDPEGGLFRERDPTAVIRPWIVESTFANGSVEKHVMIDGLYWVDQLNNSSLHGRGWVFQECFLAPRILYFARDQVLWECSESHGCEAFLEGIPGFEPNKPTTAKALRGTEQTSQGVIYRPQEAIAKWMLLAEDYSMCRLTRSEDRLYAFAGIAKLFQEITGYQYMAGVWREGLLYQLAWYVSWPVPRSSSRYRAPSWSWASIDGEMQFTPNWRKRIHFFAEIIDARITTRDTESMVDAVDGLLKLSCRVFTASYSRSSKSEMGHLELR